ncbi:MAG TPA: hypothetical protein VNH83_22280, partial [Bryobacteraceae bacterium]|nr:hypothetical protein [Bryobacteraceae bacterium]
MHIRVMLLGWMLSSAVTVSIAQTKVDLRTQGKSVDFSGASTTKPLKTGSALPAVCSLGELFFQTATNPGSNIYICTATNTWTGVADGNGQTGTGAPTGGCVAGRNTYLDTANLDYWFCDAANAWKKVVSTANTGPFSLTGQTGPAPGTPAAGLETLYLNSADKTLHTVSDAGTDMRYAGLGETNVWGAFLQDFSASTIKMPTAAGFTAITNGGLGYDSTGNQIHTAIDSVDAIIPTRGVSAPTTGNCVKWGANGQLQDQGGTCSGATQPAFSMTGDTSTLTSGLVKLSGNTVVGVVTGDTGGAIGICTSNCGIAGAQTVTWGGVAGCAFDAASAPTAGHYVIISPTTNGKCRDSGATIYPASGQVIGRTLATGSVSTTQNIDLFPAEMKASSGYATAQSNGISQPQRATINVVGDCISGSDTGGSTTNVRILDSRTMACQWDEFMGGSTSAGQIGALGWQFISNGSGGTLHSYQAIAGHPGVMQLQTPTNAANQDQYLYLANNGGDQWDMSDTWDTVTIFQAVTSDSSVQARLCVMANVFGSPSSNAANSPNNSVCLEKLFADTSWFGITRNSSIADTRTPAVGTADSNWHYLEIKRLDGNTIGFAMDGGLLQCITTAGSLPGACAGGTISATHIIAGGVGFEIQVESS